MGHGFNGRIWLNTKKQLKLEMFQHLKRRSDYSTKSYTVYGTPMEQKIQQA
jgi:hypothetical protein